MAKDKHETLGKGVVKRTQGKRAYIPIDFSVKPAKFGLDQRAYVFIDGPGTELVPGTKVEIRRRVA